jgi:hypothetical protein
MSESSTRVSALTIGGDPRRQAVVVAEADLAGRHRVVLVDDRHGAEAQQGGQRAAGIEVAAPLLGVVERQQDLRDGDLVAGQRLLVGVRQQDLAGGGGGLLLLQPQRPGRQLQVAAADRDGAGGDQDAPRSRAPGMRGDVVGQRVEPAAADCPVRLVDQQRRADLDDQPAGGRRARRSWLLLPGLLPLPRSGRGSG